MPDNGEHGPGPEIATVERREASVPVAGNARRLTSACVPVMAREPGASQHPQRLPALPTPSTGVETKPSGADAPSEKERDEDAVAGKR